MGDRWRALVADARAEARSHLAQALRGAGAEVYEAASVTEVFATLLDTSLDVAVLAHELPPGGGLSIVQRLRDDEDHRVPTLLVTEGASAEVIAQALDEGAEGVVAARVEGVELVARCRALIAAARRVRALKAEVARLHELAVTDGLTQVANHRSFQERLADEFRRAQRYDDPLALILIDLDHFKDINDRYGHPAGDQVLQALAEMLREAVRETDFVARYGGEEFAVVLPKTHLGGALSVAERICGDLRSKKIGPLGIRITASFGVSGFPSRGVGSAEELLRTADEALYRSKSQGRNRISIYQAALSAPVSA
jgi:two-component system, cell cycle response regulator